MADLPLLSILVPTHNREQLLSVTLTSILHQTAGLEQIEIIISNDASKDGTKDFLVKFAQTQSSLDIRIHNHEVNLGGPGNWKFLLEQARGEFVYLLSDDDCIKPLFLETYFKVLKNNPHVDVIYSAIEYCNEQLQPLSQSRLSSVSGLVSGSERLKNYLIANHMVMSSIYRRVIFIKAGGWQAKYETCLDGGAFAMMCTQSAQTFFIEEALFCFRLGSQTWSSFRIEKQKSMYQSFRSIIEDVLSWAQQYDSKNIQVYKKSYSAHAQGILNMLDLKMVHGQLHKKQLQQLLVDLVSVFPEAKTLSSYKKMKLVSILGIQWLQALRFIMGKKSLYGSSVFEKEFSVKGETQWV